MNIQETEIVGINYTNKVTIYTLEGKDKKYYFSVLPYSKESDFVSNAFGATHDLKLGKTAYITLNSDKEITSISSEKETCVIDLIVNTKGEYKNNSISNKEEFAKLIRYEIENNIKLIK